MRQGLARVFELDVDDNTASAGVAVRARPGGFRPVQSCPIVLPTDAFSVLAQAVSAGVAICREGLVLWASPTLEVWLSGPLAGSQLESRIGAPPACESFELPMGPTGPGPERVRVRIEALASADGSELKLWLFDPVLGAGAAGVGTRSGAGHTDLALAREVFERVDHELRTPLTVVSGYNRLLLGERAGALNDEQRFFVSESSRACERLGRLLDRLGDELGPEAPAAAYCGECELDRSIEEALCGLTPELEAAGIAVEVRLHPSARRAHFDGLRVGQVLTNLLSNAVKYGKRGGRVRVVTAPCTSPMGFVEVAVEDDGPGVDASHRQRIFEPRVRAPGSARAPGVGLGLAICREIIEAHGGRIGVEERPGGGSRFHFTLPIEAQASLGGARSADPGHIQGHSHIQGHRKEVR